MHRIIVVLAWLLFPTLLGTAACRWQSAAAPDAPEIKTTLELSPRPLTVGPITAVVSLTDPQGQPVTGAALKLEGNMSHAGMKPVFGEAKEIAPGRYQAAMEFTMGGDWFFLVDAALPDGRKVKAQIPVPGVEGR